MAKTRACASLERQKRGSSGEGVGAFLIRAKQKAELPMDSYMSWGQSEKLLWKLPIPSGAKALDYTGGFDVRAEARTLQLKPVPVN